MIRIVGVLAVIAAVFTAVVGGGIWLVVHDKPTPFPEISAYSHGHLTRVGPYFYCGVFDLNDCQNPGDVGELPVSARHPVQLSVPPEIGDAPWILVRSYEESDVLDEFRPGSTLAVTIPTTDPQRGRLFGIAVQLPTLVRDEVGNELAAWHAEWSVKTVWPQPAA